MRLEEYKYFMEQSGFQVKDDMAFGHIKGFPVLIRKKNRNGSRIKVFFAIEDVEWSNIREEIKEIAKEYKIGAIYENGQLKFTMSLKKENLSLFSQITKGIVDRLKKMGIKAPKKCCLCGQENCESFAIVGYGNYPIHKECLQEKMNSIRNNMQTGSYLLGLLGAFIGVFIGIIPCVIALLTLGEAVSVLFVLIPLCIYFSYKLFRGKMDRFVLYFTILLSIASVYLMQIVVRVVYNFQNNKDTISVTWRNIGVITKKVLTYDGIWQLMTQDSTLNFLFIIIGILITWERISVTNQKEEKDLSEVVDTVTTNPNYREQ